MAARILARPAPLVLLDACAVLDLIRTGLPERKQHPRGVADARSLVSAARATPRRVWLVATETVRLEVAEHRGPTVDEVRRDSTRLEERINSTEALMGRIFPGPPAGWTQWFDLLAKLPAELGARVDELLDAAETLRDDDRVCRDLAHIRAVCKYPPSHKKESRKDCEMYEHYRALVRRLRSGSFVGKVAFATSNTEDFDRRNSSCGRSRRTGRAVRSAQLAARPLPGLRLVAETRTSRSWTGSPSIGARSDSRMPTAT